MRLLWGEDIVNVVEGCLVNWSVLVGHVVRPGLPQARQEPMSLGHRFFVNEGSPGVGVGL